MLHIWLIKQDLEINQYLIINMDFKLINDKQLNLDLGLNQLQQKGSLVYEYNPLRVLRTNVDITQDGKVIYPKGSLIDLDTDLLDFDLNHPVDIVTQQSYDGSVNLILNNGYTYPKLINTRFSSTGMDTYQIVDREGDNDTNIYDIESFDTDVSLYKKINTVAKLNFTGLNTSGNLKVGNYVFYFKLADSDGNETDFIAESGIVTCHIGNLNDPSSIQGGIRDENSYKSVSFILSNIDSSYNNVVVYYTRSTSDVNGNELTSSFKILKMYSVYNNIAKINITGFENVQEISINDINVAYNVVSNAAAQATCQNMLFLGNVTNPTIEYKELTDLSLRFLPELNITNNIGRVNENYEDSSGGYEYYNVLNIYNKLGYWNDEIYRLGIVYILNDFTLSPVFNIRGISRLTTENDPTRINWTNYKLFKDGFNPDSTSDISTIQANREYIPINKETCKLDSQNENSKGVIKISYNGNQLDPSGTIPIGFNIKVSKEVVKELKRYTKGFFFVRQKRIPTTLCQAVTIGLENTSHLPVLPIDQSNYLVERFIDDDGVLTHDFDRRCVNIKKDSVLEGYAAICPEFELTQGYFNQLFTGTEFNVRMAKSQFQKKYFSRSGTHLFNTEYTYNSSNQEETYNIMAIGDSVKVLKGKKQLFSARAGEAEEAWRLSYYDYTNKSTNARNILRGNWGPYIGLEGYNTNKMSLIDIKIPNYEENLLDEYFEIRYQDSSSFYAISDRKLWEDYDTTQDITVLDIFRGDCYIGNYTHRMCRNFQDPSAPINDDIIDQMSWKDNYNISDEESKNKVNRGDVNAIKIGHWVTVKVCSNINLSMRCTDSSYPSEMGMSGKSRGFYPLQAMSVTGESKIPESFVINGGLNSTTSDKYYFEMPNVPAIKNKFNVRIMYSDININDSFKNGYRVFKLTHYRDYPLTYGSITKLVEWFGNIICVFEHGVALIPVNERAVAGEGAGGNVFINTSNVLPENPKMLSDTFGTQWSESVIKTPYYVYGVDTVGKKIWRTDGQVFETISDFRVQKFLNDNISITEKEKTPIIGIRNVKTHYNRFKHDVMFTFYDDINTLEENVWNLCYNEVMQKFITFYSWVPSYSENIDNIFFSFDRDTSKSITKLTEEYPLISVKGGGIISSTTLIGDKIKLGELQINLQLDGSSIEYSIADEKVRNRFFVENGNEIYANANTINDSSWTIPIKAVIYNQGTDLVEGEVKNIVKTLYSTITIVTQEKYNSLTTAFWKHGQAGLMEMKSEISPCFWYGKQHPFEFEFIVVDNPSVHKIFNNLQIISNKTKPESFHFEIVGEVYNFAKDKKNMFFRQEATKHLYQYNGGDIKFNSDYLKIKPEQRDMLYSISEYKDMTAMFPLYYSHVEPLNSVYDHYQSMTADSKDYQSISGSEIIFDKQLNEFRIATHIKGCPFDDIYEQLITKEQYKKQLSINNQIFVKCTKVYPESLGKEPEEIKARINFWELDENNQYIFTETERGFIDQDQVEYINIRYYILMYYNRLNGNMNYQEDKWDVQIPSITYWAKNEKAWDIKGASNTVYPPLNLVNNPLPEGMQTLTLKSDEDIPQELLNLGYHASTKSLDLNKWGPDRKETKIRDKYVKVKVRYTGDELAIITALKTLYTVSYA